jgi:DNA-binding NtrC family response regulator
MSYEWRGNVRELENLVQHMSILFSGRNVRLDDLPEKFTAGFDPSTPVDLPSSPVISEQPEQTEDEGHVTAAADISWESGQVDFNELINDFERQLIVQAMKITGGNKKEAARLLNLKRTTLLEKMKKKEMQDSYEG